MRNNGIYLCLASVVFLVLAEHWWGRTLAAMAFAAGLALAIWAARRLRHPRNPLFVLSAAGLAIHVPGARDVFVPWSEVRDIVTGSVAVTASGATVSALGKHENLTMIVVSREFHDREIHLDSLYRRGPGWSNVFVPRGDQVAIALHHRYLDTEATTLRRAVESFWRAGRLPHPT
jgi:hypothetical protein